MKIYLNCQPIKCERFRNKFGMTKNDIPPFRGIRKDVKDEETTIVMPTIVRDLFKRSECGTNTKC